MGKHERDFGFVLDNGDFPSRAKCDCTRPGLGRVEFNNSHGCPVHDPATYARLYSAHRANTIDPPN